jgi:hypothetical protein
MGQSAADKSIYSMKPNLHLICLLSFFILSTGQSHSEKPKEKTVDMDLSALAKKFAGNEGNPFRKATADELATLKKLTLPASLITFYSTHCPTGENVEGPQGIRLLSVKNMVEDNSKKSAPGRDVFPQGFVIFATVDGDAFCFDVKTPQTPDNPRIVLFGHEEPFTGMSREDLLEDKAKIVAISLREFLEKALSESVDVDPKY